MVINKKIILKLFKEKKLEDYTIKLIKKYNIYYKTLEKEDKELAIIDTVRKINNENRIVTSKNRKKIWEKSWLDINNSFKKNRSITSLIPQFYSKRKNLYFRLNGKFILSSKFFEFKMIDIYRSWYFSKYIKNVDNIYEFGAGSGHNLIRLSDIFPKKKSMLRISAKTVLSYLRIFLIIKIITGVVFNST